MVYFFIFRLESSDHLASANETKSDSGLAKLFKEVDTLLKWTVVGSKTAYDLLLKYSVCCFQNISIKTRIFLCEWQ
jgi:hypothetical protein